MYLGCALLDLGFELVPHGRRPAAGPDLCICSEDRRIWIEAIAPQPGTGPDAVPASGEAGGWVPEARIVLRYRAAVEEKWRKRERIHQAEMCSMSSSSLRIRLSAPKHV